MIHVNAKQKNTGQDKRLEECEEIQFIHVIRVVGVTLNWKVRSEQRTEGSEGVARCTPGAKCSKQGKDSPKPGCSGPPTVGLSEQWEE